MERSKNESHRPRARIADGLGIPWDSFPNHRYVVPSMLLDLYRGGQSHNTYVIKTFTTDPRSKTI